MKTYLRYISELGVIRTVDLSKVDEIKLGTTFNSSNGVVGNILLNDKYLYICSRIITIEISAKLMSSNDMKAIYGELCLFWSGESSKKDHNLFIIEQVNMGIIKTRTSSLDLELAKSLEPIINDSK